MIGRAVNEVSRMEKLRGELGRSPLLSDTFAGRCASPLGAPGTFAPRWLDVPRTIWTT